MSVILNRRTNCRIPFTIALIGAILAPSALLAESAPPLAAAGQPLPKLLDIAWSRGPNLPQGLQDSDGGFLGDSLVSVGGFCSGGLEEDNRRKPGRYPRGFLRKGWALDESAHAWRAIPDFPGVARQGLFSAVVDESLYFWGGFNYDAPFCYRDGWRLTRAGEAWEWHPLPPLPWNLTSSALGTIDGKIYCAGGADYDGVKGFTTEADREGRVTRLGARLLVFDTRASEPTWEELPACPGTPRFVQTAQVVDGKLYVIGGATGVRERDGVSLGYCTVVDNWRFDPADASWTRLADLPVSSGNFPRSPSLVYKNRYIVLPGGHQYTYVARPDGTFTDKFGVASQKRPESGLHNDVFVYDVRTGTFGAADPLPIDNNLPMAVIRGDRLHLLGGETGGGFVDGEYYGHHPDLYLIGTMREVDAK